MNKETERTTLKMLSEGMLNIRQCIADENESFESTPWNQTELITRLHDDRISIYSNFLNMLNGMYIEELERQEKKEARAKKIQNLGQIITIVTYILLGIGITLGVIVGIVCQDAFCISSAAFMVVVWQNLRIDTLIATIKKRLTQ